jgi:uncharacterized protein YndB with AHSA1/START domain
MGLSVCPAAIVAAPVEDVWALLADPAKYGEWADADVERVVPEGPITPGQMIYLTTKAFGRSWHIVFRVEMVDPDRHQVQTHVTFPLGMTLQERISCTPIDATSCRVQYG